MPPKHKKNAGDKHHDKGDGYGKKTQKGGAHAKHGKGQKKKKKAQSQNEAHDEVEDLFPSIEVRFPVEPAEIEVNAEHENSYYHQFHENQDIQNVDFTTETKHFQNGATAEWIPSAR